MPISLTNINGTGGITFIKNTVTGGINWVYGTNQLLDIYSGSSMALSLRKLKWHYQGPAIRVQRSSDSAQQDIGFIGTELDTSTLTSFVGSGTGTVVTWYDQSGNGYNVSKIGTSDTPDIIISGVLQTLNGKPALRFNGSKMLQGQITPNIYSAQKEFIAFAVANALDTNVRLVLMLSFSPTLGGTVNSQAIRRSGNFLQAIAYNTLGTTVTDTGNVNVGTSQFIACTERSTTIIEAWTNNLSDGGQTLSGTPGGSNPVPLIGSFNFNSPGFAWNGNIQEVIVFALNPSTNTTYRNDVTTALNSYYTTY